MYVWMCFFFFRGCSKVHLFLVYVTNLCCIYTRIEGNLKACIPTNCILSLQHILIEQSETVEYVCIVVAGGGDFQLYSR